MSRAEQVGDGLAEFFEDFNAKEETEQVTASSGPSHVMQDVFWQRLGPAKSGHFLMVRETHFLPTFGHLR